AAAERCREPCALIPADGEIARPALVVAEGVHELETACRSPRDGVETIDDLRDRGGAHCEIEAEIREPVEPVRHPIGNEALGVPLLPRARFEAVRELEAKSHCRATTRRIRVRAVGPRPRLSPPSC